MFRKGIWIAALAVAFLAGAVGADPVRTCDSLAEVTFEDGSRVTSAQEAQTGSTVYCQLTVLVPERINIILLLPKTTWNGRYQAAGNAGYGGTVMQPPGLGDQPPPTEMVAQGYAASSTDTGHQGVSLSGEWAWSPTGMNHAQIQDFAYRANHEMAVKSKALINLYYGVGPTYSYWNGCSTGGREGLTAAMRFPGDFDGIFAGAPAINWTRFIPAELWPQVVMNEFDNFLPACKANVVSGLVMQACDLSDGLQDGQFDSRECNFSAQSLLSESTPCGSFTAADVAVIGKIWQGARRANGDFLWYGLEPGADLGSLPGLTLAATVSAPDGTAVDGIPFPISHDWFKWWLYKDPSWNWRTVTSESFPTDFDQSVSEWADVLATNNPDLSAFRARGGKLVIWHGLGDSLIFPRGTLDYYNRVLQQMGGLESVQKFARLFLAPNAGHCGTSGEPGKGDGGPVPSARADGFGAVVNWVEDGVAPNRIIATSGSRTRPLCPYPQVARYMGFGSIEQAANFECVTRTSTGLVCDGSEPDFDGDGIPDLCDNCVLVANAGQEDDGGIDTTEPDGIGNACQCGDVTGNGIVNGLDAKAIQRHGLGLQPNDTFDEPGNCDVTGGGACNGQDANAVKRVSLGLASSIFGQNCHNALGIPVPPGL